MFLNCLAVGCGGFVGSVLRYLVGNAVPASVVFILCHLPRARPLSQPQPGAALGDAGVSRPTPA